MKHRLFALSALTALTILAKGGVSHAVSLPFQEPPRDVLIQSLLVELEPPKQPEIAPKVVTEFDNPQNCNTDTQWIASEEPFYCIEKMASPQISSGAYSNYTSSGNTYPTYQCTWFVKSMRRDIPNYLGDARFWFSQLSSLGWVVGYTPRAGAIGQSIYGNHVVYVFKVDGAQIYLGERNYDYKGSYRERWADASSFKYIYSVKT